MAQRYTLLLQCHDEMAGKRGHQQKNIKKIAGCSTTYPKSPYLCNVLIKQLIVLRFKKAKKMKKLVLMAVAIVAVSFASCSGNKAANTEATETAAPATEEVATAANDSAAVANDSVAADTTVAAE